MNNLSGVASPVVPLGWIKMTMLKCCLLLLGVLMSCSSQEIIKAPENITVIIDQFATFTCQTRGGFSGWTVNNSPLETFEGDILPPQSDFVDMTTIVELSIRARAEYDRITIQCVVANITGGVTLIESAVLIIEDVFTATSIIPSSVAIGGTTSISLPSPSPSLIVRPGDSNTVAIVLGVVIPLLVIVFGIVVVIVIICCYHCLYKRKRALGSTSASGEGLTLSSLHGFGGHPSTYSTNTTEVKPLKYFKVHIEGPPNVHVGMILLSSVASKWKDIAKDLKIKQEDLTIDRDEMKNEEHLKAVLDHWIKNTTNPKWEDLAPALKDSTLELETTSLTGSASE